MNLSSTTHPTRLRPMADAAGGSAWSLSQVHPRMHMQSSLFISTSTVAAIPTNIAHEHHWRGRLRRGSRLVSPLGTHIPEQGTFSAVSRRNTHSRALATAGPEATEAYEWRGARGQELSGHAHRINVGSYRKGHGRVAKDSTLRRHLWAMKQ